MKDKDNILLIEDSEFIQEVVIATLKRSLDINSVNLLIAKTKGEAFKILWNTEIKIKAVLLDWDLGNGYEESFEILRYLFSVRRDIHQIISISGDRGVRFQHLDSWATHQIDKPEISGYLRSILEKKEWKI